MASIELIDDFFDEETYLRLLSFAEHCPMYPGYKSHTDNDPHGHWLAVLTGTDRFNKDDASDTLPVDVIPAWNKVREIITHKCLVTSYINGHTYGTEGYFHRDWHEPEYVTVIVYLVRGEWDPDWGGETVFIDDDKNIRASIFPKANRIVVFPSNLNHCARGVTRKFNGIRRTLMFKTKLEINTSA
jgi:SM-20-related protein